MAGYSGTPLAKKLGLKPGVRLHVSGAPDNYLSLLKPLPAGVKFVRAVAPTTDIVHLFATSKAALESALHRVLGKLKPDGAIWVSWPKKSAKVASDITEDSIRSIALPLGLVDIKVCAVDEIWSGLKLVVRKKHRPKPQKRRLPSSKS